MQEMVIVRIVRADTGGRCVVKTIRRGLPMKIANLFSVCLLLSALSCNFSANFGTSFHTLKKDNEIKPEIKAELDGKNAQLLNSIKSNNPHIMYDMFVDEVKKQQNVASMRNYYSSIVPIVSGQTFTKTHDYYIDVLGKTGDRSIVLFDTNIDDLNIVVPSKRKYLYLSFYETAGYFNDTIITILYGKDEKGKWELLTFFVGAYKVMNNNANSLYRQVKELLDKDYLVPAILRYQVMAKYLNPSPLLAYKNNKEFEKLKDVLAEKAKKFVFPITIDSMPSKPEVYGFEGVFIKQEFVPVIRYYSKNYNSPNNVLQNEVDDITKQLDAYFVGMRATANTILFQIFSEPPIDKNKKYSTKALSSVVSR